MCLSNNLLLLLISLFCPLILDDMFSQSVTLLKEVNTRSTSWLCLQYIVSTLQLGNRTKSNRMR